MRNILLIFVFILLSSFSCEDERVTKYKKFIDEIIEKPDLILDIESNYPEIYNDSLVYIRFKKPEDRKDVIKSIKKEFKLIDCDNDYLIVYLDRQG